MPKTNNMLTNEKADLREYLLSTRDFWGQYRTQKENAAWVAATVYLGALLALDSLVVQNRWPYFSGLLLRVVVLLLVLVSGYLTYRFIDKQNTDRKLASDIVSACGYVNAEVFSLKELPEGWSVKRRYEDQKEFPNEEWWFPHILFEQIIKRRKTGYSQRIWWNTEPLFFAMILWTFATLSLLIIYP